MLRNYFKMAVRSLWKSKTTSLINIGGLAVGMTTAVLIMLWVNNEVSYDSFHKDEHRIYRLTSRLSTYNWVWESTPLLLADAIKKELPDVDNTTRLFPNHWPVFTVNGSAFYQKNCAYVDSDWFNIFHYDFIEGDALAFSRHPSSIILTVSEAKRYFGGSSAIAKSMLIDGKNFTVRAVVADPPLNSSLRYNAFIPLAALLTDVQRKENDEQWGNYNYITFIKTASGAKTKDVAAKISGILKKNDGNGATAITLTSLTDMHFETEIENSSFGHGNLNTVYVFSVLAVLLLVIACINYVNLTTAKASLRAKEVSIRKITGASRSALFFQFISESLLVCILAIFTTFLLISLALPAFNEVTGKSFTLPITSPALWQTAGITLLAAFLLNSIYPALLLSSFKPLQVFRGITVLKTKDGYFRKGLVVLQFTVSVILISGTIIIYSQMGFIQKTNPGYNRSAVLSFAVPQIIDRQKKEAAMKTIKQELLLKSNIENVSTCNQPVVNIGSACTECADWEGRDTSYNPKITQLSADDDFFKTMQLQMKEGQWFSETSSSDNKGFVLNETAVKDFNLALPVIGKRFIFKGDTGRIIGVVKDFSFKSMHERTGPLVVFNNALWQNHFMVRIAPNSAAAAVADIEKVWKKHFPGVPIEYNFLDDTFDNLYSQDRQSSLLVLVFAIIAVLISALGLFSLAAFSAEQRTKEIGIRKVLGATVAGITTLLSKDFVKLVCVAILIATPVAWWAMNNWIQNFAYRIDLSWWIFMVAGMIAVTIALITVSFQAIKAAITNPVKSLRTE